MKVISVVFVGALGVMLAACGEHAQAPVVYGTQPGSTARIYRSADDYYGRQRLERIQASQRPKAQQAVIRSDIEPVQLTPAAVASIDKPQAATLVEQKPIRGANRTIDVRPGDTVYALGRRYHVSPQSIIEENDLRAPYLLKIGQTLKLPADATVAAAETQARRVTARDTLYSVRDGDTLYSISRASKVPVDKIASANGLRAPYTLSVGRQLLIPQTAVNELIAEPARQKSRPVKREASAPQNVAELTRDVSYTPPKPAESKSLFAWPVRGAIIAEYGSGELGRRNDGVNIAAPAGTAVRAAADGEVVYRGSELDGFGNLLLIKHEDGFVTAYAHNDVMLVKKGDLVQQGQVIAKVGQTGAVTTPQLHFEIRQNLKSVDPIALLGSQ